MKKLMFAAVAVGMAAVAGAAEWDGKYEAVTIKGKVLDAKAVKVVSTKLAGLYDVSNKCTYVWNADSKAKKEFTVGGRKQKLFVCDTVIPGEITVIGDAKAKKNGRAWSNEKFNGVAFGNAKSASGSYVISGEEYGTWKIAQDKTLASLKKIENPQLVDVLLKKKVELEIAASK